ncbi:MAG TPA: hypothetical protein VN155_14560 [Devosia sp.]|nr:hypothetical protein [Devosia sp.]
MPQNADKQDAAFAAIRAALMASYSGTLASTRLSPLDALEYLAAAIGSIYREVADAHLDPDGCPCGWEPCDVLDIVALQQAIAANASIADEADPFDLRTLAPAGHG